MTPIMDRAPTAAEALRDYALALIGCGRDYATPAAEIAERMGVSTRTVGGLVADLIDEGYLIGSTCSGPHPGYFLIVSEADLEVGTAHIRARAMESLRRVRALERLARARFGDERVQHLRLFEVDP